MSSKTGVLLINLGSPASPRIADVREYLREFLGDPRVLTLPGVLRALLLNGVILPTRPRKSAAAYEKIWTPEGSPLLVNSQKFRETLAQKIPNTPLELAMRYGKPDIATGLHKLLDQGVDSLLAFPLYPQEAESSTGTAVAKVEEELAKLGNPVDLKVVPPFFSDGGFTHSMGLAGRRMMHDFPEWEHILFSFHGLPVSHLKKADSAGTCLAEGFTCCDKLESNNQHCYRAQCVHTANLIARFMGIPYPKYSIAFQSRLGKSAWILPYTRAAMERLGAGGIKNLIVLCPSFVADCLETLEEIGMRMRDIFIEAGGVELRLAPCLNDDDNWIHAAKNLILENIEPIQGTG